MATIPSNQKNSVQLSKEGLDMQYQLNIEIDNTGLDTIYGAGLAVTLVKSVIAAPLVSGNLPIAWIEFHPFETNVVTWVENYYAYATTTVLQSGATLAMTSQTATPVQDGWTYTFANGQFTAAQGGGNGVYTVENAVAGSSFNFGLAQQATVNNVATLAPLNAQPLPYNMEASFTPEETVSIFLSSYVNNGVVISQVASNALTVTLTSQSPTASIGYNDAKNSFYLSGQSLVSPHQHAQRLGRRLAAAGPILRSA